MVQKQRNQDDTSKNRMYLVCKQNGITISPTVCIFVLNENNPIDKYGLAIEQPIAVENIKTVIGQTPDPLTVMIIERLNYLFDEAVKTPTKQIQVTEMGQDGRKHKIDGKFETVDSNEVWAWRKAKQAIANVLFPEAMEQARDIYAEAHKKHEKATIANLERRIAEEQEKARVEREQAQKDREQFMEFIHEMRKQMKQE